MVTESPVSHFTGVAQRLSLSILPLMLMAATGSWASDAEQNEAAVNSSGTDSAAGGIRHIDVNDPPPFQIIATSTSQAPEAPQGAACPPFLFRNGLESGVLTQPGGPGTIVRYVTSGGYVLEVLSHTITFQDPIAMNQIQHWGDPHENLNGKHIKDWAGAAGWEGNRRTILLADGTKVTMESTGPNAVVTKTSIYDDKQNVEINNTTNTIAHHSLDLADTISREAAQHDGETAEFITNITTGSATYTNIYNEDASFVVVSFNTTLGISGGCANPNNVSDYFDDPRLGHT